MPPVYDYDDFYDYDDQDDGVVELNAEDSEKMRDGTAAVRKALASAPEPVNITVADIQDALWHYYFDVNKSVQYLAKKFAPKKPKMPKTSQADTAKNSRVSTPKPSTPKPPTATMQAMKIQETKPLPKRKNLDVAKEYEAQKSHKKNVSFTVVGHVDHGKSTMMGRLLLDLGAVSERTITKYKREAEALGKASFFYAWVLDQGSEERERGVTVDVARIPFETPTTNFTILDAPGHKDFIPNMISGATQADFAILVVDAGPGAFESGLRGQTREHALLLRAMGISRIIVAINKMDSSRWSQERFDDISLQVTTFMKANKFRLNKITFVPVSGLAGDNIVNRSTTAEASWYTGPTLLEELETVDFDTAKAMDKPLRMTIQDITKDFISPLTAVGRIEAGSLQVGDALRLQPAGEKAYVKGLLVNKDLADFAVAGQYVDVHLSHIDAAHVKIGDVVCHPSSAIQCVDSLTVKAMAFETLMPMTVDIIRGRIQTKGDIRLVHQLDPVTGEVVKKKPKSLKARAVGRMTVSLRDKIPLEAGQRIVMRSDGSTIAAGLLE